MPFVLIWPSTLYTWADVTYCTQEISAVSMCQLKVTCIKKAHAYDALFMTI